MIKNLPFFALAACQLIKKLKMFLCIVDSKKYTRVLPYSSFSFCCDPDATIWKLDGSPKDLLANSLQTRIAPSIKPSKSKPVNCSHSQNAPFIKWKQDTDLALSWGCKERPIISIWHSHQSKTIKSWSGSGVMGATFWVSRRWRGLGRRN